jgi:hypothetical protein
MIVPFTLPFIIRWSYIKNVEVEAYNFNVGENVPLKSVIK